MDEIKVWKWEDAPKSLRDLSPHGGDEDWVALVPNKFQGVYIAWLEQPFGCFDVSEHTHPDFPDHFIKIGAHG